MNKENCQGCRSFFDGIAGICPFLNKESIFGIGRHLIGECPCGKCIIKGICGVSCEEFNKAHSLIPLKGNR